MTKSAKRRTAVALQTDLASGITPVVAATGQGDVAEEIIAIARANGIPVQEDPMLAMALSQIQMGHEIPAALYEVVAELLVFLYRVDAIAEGQVGV